ncbi:YicC/YloC family endoribonuclease [Arcticibacterium luteifluviistationis]|uniref:YicC family protein n=1 Tax=Arcticibacterium luteifluviistationis TaxID=1784714 RepID=A0A2Z4GAV8_9BACT|nr:YicC/YloC family endoribonuclease [Arcticibacterium luteifluviistationis]AWV98170.1 YicC family protein [Arcticibacterium luteifluviistationis]
MLQSMTGFGSAAIENDKLAVSAEVKTLNSKFTDIFCRMPRTYSDKEVELRNLLSTELSRGKMELSLNVVSKDEGVAGTSVNRGLVKAYFKDLMATAKELDFDATPTDILRMATMMPNAYITNVVNDEAGEEEWKLILDTVKLAITKCQEFRSQEGAVTAEKFKEYIANIAKHLEAVIEQDPHRVPQIRERIEKAISELVQSDNFNQDRFEQELVYYVEKYDISEEKVRLGNHLTYFVTELEKGTNGKRLNFISQEIGREINTIGSKANDAIIQKLVVQMKDELEKIKEQTLNIV